MLAEYEILGVDKNAGREEITAAYRRAAMRWHPDRNPDDPQAKERFQEIERAYRLLLKITPQMRLLRPPPPAPPAPPPPDDMVAAAEAAAAAAREEKLRAWRAARAAEAEHHRRYESAREQAHAEEEARAAASPYRIKTPLPAAVLLLCGGGLWALLPPLHGIAGAAALALLATLLCPPEGRSYTEIILCAVVHQGVKLYFLALLAWGVFETFGTVSGRF